MPRRSCGSALVLALTGLVGCNVARIGVNQMAPVLKAGAPVFYTEGDVQFAREAMPGTLKLVEGLLETSPHNEALLLQLAEGYCGYAFLFIEDDYEALRPGDEDARAPLAARASGFYQRCGAYAVRVLEERHKGFGRILGGLLPDLEAALRKVEAEDVPALFWLSFSEAAYVNLNRDKIEAVANLGRIEALLARVIELDERFFYGAAHLARGGLMVARPKLLGGEPDRGRAEIERALALSGGKFLMHKILLARIYAVSVGDRALFERILREILATPTTVLPEMRLANEIAHRRAQRYLGLIDELF